MPITEKTRIAWGAAMACLAAAQVSLPTCAAGLNDTGQMQCLAGSVLQPCSEANTGDASTYPGQDGRFGRDAAATAGILTKTGGGSAGFDFTKLAVDGTPLADQGNAWSHDTSGFDNGTEAAGTVWSCVWDNVTGLTWGVKTRKSTPDLRDYSWSYTWYEPDGTLNGGHAGTEDGTDNCFDTARCDTDKYVGDVNGQNICGETTEDDWRLPTREELVSIVHFGADGAPYIDSGYFPNTVASWYCSSSSYASNPVTPQVWRVNLGDGIADIAPKSSGCYVRLVRGG